MVIFKRPALSYRLCDHTVTIYRRIDSTTFTRRVVHDAFLDYRKNRNIDKTGAKDASSFLLILPTSDPQALRVEDKVCMGEGPRIGSQKEWNEFIPAKVPGLAVVKYVDPKYYHGACVHIEAGG